jgi:HAD superfamily hydrolase (TIGR01509 family)
MLAERTQLPIRAVLFDHDGTLVDSEPAHFRMWQEVLAPYGVALSEKQYRDNYAGVPTAANAVDMVSRFAINEVPATLTDAKNSAVRAFLARTAFPLMPGVREVLQQFRSGGLRLAVVTGAGGNGVQATLKEHSLNEFFETVVSGDDVRRNKPAPDCYLLASERLGLHPSECIAIEDTEHGVNAATSAGMACLAVPTGMSKHHDFSKASAVFGELSAAASWVRNHADAQA